MADNTLPPFSGANRGAHARIDNACPETARIGLHHILQALVARKYVGGWAEVISEIHRIARISPDAIDNRSVDELLSTLAWDKVFDFCERLYSNFTRRRSLQRPNRTD